MSTPQDPDDPYRDDAPPPPGWTYPAPPPGTGMGGPGGMGGIGPEPQRHWAPRPGSRPGSVVAAVICWVFAGIILIGSGVLTVAGAGLPETRREVARLFAESDVPVTDAMLRQLLLFSGTASIVLGVLTLVLGVLLLGGSNRVRVLITVVGLLDMLMVLFGALFVLAALVLQFLPASNAWWRARDAGRAA